MASGGRCGPRGPRRPLLGISVRRSDKRTLARSRCLRRAQRRRARYHSASTTREGIGGLATGTTFGVGQMRVHILDDGVFVTDAGNLFGGSRKASIKGAMHPILVDTGDDLALIDAGFGPELPEMLEGRYELRREENLLDHMDEAGFAAGDVTGVIISHLDPDHVGWALNPPSFPNATVYVQEAALEEARRMPDKDGRRAAVPAVEKGVDEGWCELLNGDDE